MRIAIFGGTFDPIHEAHLRVAEEAVRVAHLDRVLLVPASNPPHKPGQTHAPYEDRLKMVELATLNHEHLEASAIERRQGRSYSIDTIRQVRASLPPRAELFFLIGADAFAEIETWHLWQEVMTSVQFLVVARPGYQYRVPEGARVTSIDSLALPVSSSEIRRQLDAGTIPPQLAPAVAEYISRNGLYGFEPRRQCAIL